VGVTVPDRDADELNYVCAAEVSKFGAVPKGLVKLVLAPATYAVFAHDGHISTLHETFAAIWNDWFPESGRTPVEAPSLERHNPAFDTRTGQGGVTVWIPLQA
jgi:AraC family transcriptional regulator